ncbi:MAG: sodium-dependent transporter [Methanosphaera sp. rholeuAM74]|nr:MAG: sodium-dependent transporter [Methanosphaera sp. rholeuAM74]
MAQKNKWNSSLNFLLAMIGSAVGLGNIWRYPYIAYTNGGGTFLIPYIISILCMGIPLLFIEYGAGFKFKAGISKILTHINKKYEYIAWYIQLIPFMIVTYYSCIVAWDLIYIPSSLTKAWGTNPDNFFTHTVLNSIDGFQGLLSISIYVLIALMIIWFIAWFISHKNINDGLAKANKILIPLLFAIMTAIIIYSLTLPGSTIGVNAFLRPDWTEITNHNIWLAAFGQIFFSLNLGLTIVIAYASYLPDDVNIPKNAILVAIANSAFEVATAIGIFAILGHMSQTTHTPLNQLITQGTGLAFIAFPQVLNIIGKAGYIIGPLFFMCILFAGITSLISLIEPITLSVTNKFGHKRKYIVSVVCLSGFIISILYTTSAGSAIIGLYDGFLSQFALLLNALLEIIIIGWIYGVDKLVDGINKNSEKVKLGTKWIIAVKYVIPLIITSLWITGIITLIKTEDIFQLTMLTILIILLITVPAILTKLPADVNDYN